MEDGEGISTEKRKANIKRIFGYLARKPEGETTRLAEKKKREKTEITRSVA